MKRIFVLIVALALMLSLFAGCGVNGRRDDGSNVSTTDDGTVNGTNPDVPGMDDGMPDRGIIGGVETARTHNGSR